jgi:hypothetical protein
MGATDSKFGGALPLVRPLDDEQARLVEILLSAGGEDVSFEELRRQGIENPAVLAYELEIAGLPISHVHRPRPGGGPTSVGLRLDVTVAVAASSPERTPQNARGDLAGAADPLRRSGQRERPRPALLPVAVTAVAAFVLIVLVVALTDGSGNGGATNQPAKLALEGSRAAPSAPVPTQQVPAARPPASHARRHPSRSSAGSRQAEHVAPLSPAAKLQLAGGQLLQEGRYAAAIPELRSALSASGESAASCAEPTSSGCVAYAEALYDLGRALRLDNAPAAAGAVLRARLKINTQGAAVRHELGLNSKPQTRAPATRRSTHTTAPRATTTPAAPAKPRSNTGGAAAPAGTAP